jgi:hypothetical protein
VSPHKHKSKPPRRPRRTKPPVEPIGDNPQYNPEVSLQQLRLIGRVIVRWGKMEAALDDLIWHLLDLHPDIGRLLTNKMDASRKIQLIRTLAEICMPQDMFFALSPVLDDIDVLREDRNFIAHANWFTSLAPKYEPMAMSIREKAAPGQVVSESFGDKRMWAIARGIDLAKQHLIDVMERIATSPDRFRRQRYGD